MLGSPALPKAGRLFKSKQATKPDNGKAESKLLEPLKLPVSKPDPSTSKAVDSTSHLSVPENGSAKDPPKKGPFLNRLFGKPAMDVSPLTGRHIDRTVGVDKIKEQFEGSTEKPSTPSNPSPVHQLPPRPKDKQKENKGGEARDITTPPVPAAPADKKEEAAPSGKNSRANSLKDEKGVSLPQGEGDRGIKKQGSIKSSVPADNRTGAQDNSKKTTRSDSIREDEDVETPSSPNHSTASVSAGKTSVATEVKKGDPKLLPSRGKQGEKDTQSPKSAKKWNQPSEAGPTEGDGGSAPSNNPTAKPIPPKPDAFGTGDRTSDKQLTSKLLGNVGRQPQLDSSSNDEPSLPSRPGKGDPPLPSKPAKDEPSLPSKPGKGDPPLPSKPAKDEPSLPSKPGKGDPPLPSKPAKDEPSLPYKPGKGDPPLPSKPAKDEPSLPFKPGKGDPPLPSKPAKDEPSLPSKPGKGDPPLPSKPGKGDPPLPSKPAKDEPSLPSKPAKDEPSLPPRPAKNEPPLPTRPAKDELPSLPRGASEENTNPSKVGLPMASKQLSKDESESTKESPKAGRGSIKGDKSRPEAPAAKRDSPQLSKRDSPQLPERGRLPSKLPSKDESSTEEQRLSPALIKEESPSPVRSSKAGQFLPQKQTGKDEVSKSARERSSTLPLVKEEAPLPMGPTKVGQGLSKKQTSKDEAPLPMKSEPSPSVREEPPLPARPPAKPLPKQESIKLPPKEEPPLPARPGKGAPLPTGAKENSSCKKRQ